MSIRQMYIVGSHIIKYDLCLSRKYNVAICYTHNYLLVPSRKHRMVEGLYCALCPVFIL